MAPTLMVTGLYFKPGADLAHHLGQTATPADAFRAHAKQMESAAAALEYIAELIDDVPAEWVSVDADTHMILLNVPQEIADELVENGVAEEMSFEEDP
jgi:hypothetical protein